MIKRHVQVAPHYIVEVARFLDASLMHLRPGWPTPLVTSLLGTAYTPNEGHCADQVSCLLLSDA